MHLFLVDLLCCPECRQFPLELSTLESDPTADTTAGPTCHRHCGRDQVSLADPGRTVCDDCLVTDVRTGFLYCTGCARFYFIIDGIPRLISEHFSELIDVSLTRRFERAFDDRRPELEAFIDSLRRTSARSDLVQWNIDDVWFWEERVYGDDDSTALAMAQITLGRPDAGNRTYPRERDLFRHIRPALPGRTMLDLGCGLAQTIRIVCDPDAVGYVYIGADLSISALRTNRKTMRGEFVQCSADKLPFREEAVDVVLTLGTIHHLADHDGVLSQMIATVRAGGLIGLEEVVAQYGLSRRIRGLGRLRTAESAHNESVDPDLLERKLSEAGMLRVCRREYSPVRALLCALLAEPMRSRPWLTKVVLGIDTLCIRTLGRYVPFFAGHAAIMLSQRWPGPQIDARPPRVSAA